MRTAAVQTRHLSNIVMPGQVVLNTHKNAGSCADRDVEKLSLSRDVLNLRPTCTSKICGSFLLSSHVMHAPTDHVTLGMGKALPTERTTAEVPVTL